MISAALIIFSPARNKSTLLHLLAQLTKYLRELIQEVVLIHSSLLPDRQNPTQLFLTALLAISEQEETHNVKPTVMCSSFGG